MKRKTWRDKLTKAQRDHLKETTRGTLESFWTNRNLHLADIEAGKPDPCFICKDIARRLSNDR